MSRGYNTNLFTNTLIKALEYKRYDLTKILQSIKGSAPGQTREKTSIEKHIKTIEKLINEKKLELFKSKVQDKKPKTLKRNTNLQTNLVLNLSRSSNKSNTYKKQQKQQKTNSNPNTVRRTNDSLKKILNEFIDFNNEGKYDEANEKFEELNQIEKEYVTSGLFDAYTEKLNAETKAKNEEYEKKYIAELLASPEFEKTPKEIKNDQEKIMKNYAKSLNRSQSVLSTAQSLLRESMTHRSVKGLTLSPPSGTNPNSNSFTRSSRIRGIVSETPIPSRKTLKSSIRQPIPVETEINYGNVSQFQTPQNVVSGKNTPSNLPSLPGRPSSGRPLSGRTLKQNPNTSGLPRLPSLRR